MEAERKSHSVSMSSLRLKTTAPKEIKNELRTIKRKNGWSWRIIPVAVFIITLVTEVTSHHVLDPASAVDIDSSDFTSDTAPIQVK